jgi:hypothetical protein
LAVDVDIARRFLSKTAIRYVLDTLAISVFSVDLDAQEIATWTTRS